VGVWVPRLSAGSCYKSLALPASAPPTFPSNQHSYISLIHCPFFFEHIIMVSGHLGNVTKTPEYETVALHGAQEPDPMQVAMAQVSIFFSDHDFCFVATDLAHFLFTKHALTTSMTQLMALQSLRGQRRAMFTHAWEIQQIRCLNSVWRC
jgi:hypothetical protein